MRSNQQSACGGALSWAWVAALMVFAACSPALDWRLTPIPGTSLTTFFPCKPDHFSRQINLAGNAERVVLVSCKAAQHTFAVTAVDMQHAERRAQGLAALMHAAQENFGGFSQTLPPRVISAAADAGRVAIVTAQLRSPTARPLQVQMAFFSHGHWVFQATVMGETLAPEAVFFFFDNLKLRH